MQPLWTKKKSCSLSGHNKITQNLGTKNKSRNLLGQKNHPTSWDKKNHQPLRTKKHPTNLKKKNLATQKMPFSYFSNIRRTQFDQSSPVHPFSESRGGTMSVTKDKRKSLCLILDGQQNSLKIEFLREKIEGNPRWISKEPSMHFRKANMQPSMHFRRPKTETY